jgi:hypothetical protein
MVIQTILILEFQHNGMQNIKRWIYVRNITAENSVSPVFTFPIPLVIVDFTTNVKQYKADVNACMCPDTQNFVWFIVSYCEAHIFK